MIRYIISTLYAWIAYLEQWSHCEYERDQHDVYMDGVNHTCPNCCKRVPDTWFDRELDGPCERMMDRCSICGAGMDCLYTKSGDLDCINCPRNPTEAEINNDK